MGTKFLSGQALTKSNLRQCPLEILVHEGKPRQPYLEIVFAGSAGETSQRIGATPCPCFLTPFMSEFG
ncbi:MAG: hypothetical protein N3B10_02775 [Armatimonadetes bacterium]|nr:hypothetical protein [Armatimonadota bacterium]MCX7967395.1 hypothetical protein [Armatimonadota bacterium]MDW8142628.1 hypothetical protein [Armatimonadota bacterium]